MCNLAKFFIVFLELCYFEEFSSKFSENGTSALSSVSAQCDPSGLECCLAEFVSIVTPSGIKLSEQRLAGVCTQKDETLTCLDLFLDQCLKNDTDSKDVENIVNKTQDFILAICPSTSDFMAKLRERETCILNSTSEFQACYNKAVSPLQVDKDIEGSKKICCEYKELRNCASKSVEDRCSGTASQLIHQEMVHTNGAVLEWLCNFDNCPNSAVTLASSALFAVLCSFVFLKFLL